MYTQHPNATREQRETFAGLCSGKPTSRNLLTLANVLSVRKGKFDFKIQKDGTNQLPCETRLEMADAFYVYALQIAVQKFKVIAGVPVIPITEEMTWNCPKAFPGKVDSMLEAHSVRTVWNAKLSFGNRGKVRLPEQDTKQFLFTPQDALTDSSRGFVILDTPLLLKGNETDTFTMVLPDYMQDAIVGRNTADEAVTDTVNIVIINALGSWCVDYIKPKTT